MMARQLLPTSSSAETIFTERSPRDAAPQKNLEPGRTGWGAHLAAIHTSMDGAKAEANPAAMNRVRKMQMVL